MTAPPSAENVFGGRKQQGSELPFNTFCNSCIKTVHY